MRLALDWRGLSDTLEFGECVAIIINAPFGALD